MLQKPRNLSKSMSLIGRFLSDTERVYLDRRMQWIEQCSPQFVADNPFLFATRYSVGAFMARIKLFELVRDIPGYIVECGVAHGNHLMLLAHLSSLYEPFAMTRRVVGFDTFSGFSKAGEHDPQDIPSDAFANCDPAAIAQAVELFDLNRPANNFDRVQVIQGDVCDTIPAYVKSTPELAIALLYLDLDLYEPTLVALRELTRFVVRGGLIAFDEFAYAKFSGETVAIREFFGLSNLKVRQFQGLPMIAYTVVE